MLRHDSRRRCLRFYLPCLRYAIDASAATMMMIRADRLLPMMMPAIPLAPLRFTPLIRRDAYAISLFAFAPRHCYFYYAEMMPYIITLFITPLYAY